MQAAVASIAPESKSSQETANKKFSDRKDFLKSKLLREREKITKLETEKLQRKSKKTMKKGTTNDDRKKTESNIN